MRGGMTAFVQASLDLGLQDTAPPAPAAVIGLRRGLAAAGEPGGVVYTRPWAVDLILDLAGYTPDRDLAACYAVEPSAGRGAFLAAIIRRLLASLDRHGRSLADARESVRAFELDQDSADQAAAAAERELLGHGVGAAEAAGLARQWIVTGDYLLASAGDRRADFVVGNPPYIRYDEIPPQALAVYRGLYPTMVGRGDIYVGFIEAGLRQLAPGGVLSFICADRWMRSAYGSGLRAMVGEAFAVEAVIQMHDAAAFDSDVAAYPAVVAIRRGPQQQAIVASAGAEAGPASGGSLAKGIAELARGGNAVVPGFTAAMAPHWFRGTGPWPSLEPRQLGLLRLLEERFGPLEDDLTGTRVSIGVATGADRVFITTDQALAEPDRMLPLAMTGDTRQGVLQWSGHYLLDPWHRDRGLVDLNGYPRLRAHFERNRAQLTGRHVARRKPADWYRTIDPVRHDLVGQPKLYFPDLKMTSQPVLDQGETYPHHNLYYLTSREWDLEVLGGLLLSRIAQLFIEAYCVRMSGGTLRFQAQYLRRIRVPDPDGLQPGLSERLRQAFRARDVEAATSASAEAYGIAGMTGIPGC
jgi:adenine-specific DNA-methyltransferase